MVRQLKHHEKKLLKKVDFLRWKSDDNLRELQVSRAPGPAEGGGGGEGRSVGTLLRQPPPRPGAATGCVSQAGAQGPPLHGTWL